MPVMVFMGLLGLLFTPLSYAQSPSPHVQIFSTFGSSSQELFVPVNSSSTDVYPDWHIFLFGTGSFTFSVNGTVVETGQSVSDYNLTYDFNVPGNTRVNASLQFMGTTYSFSDIIVGPLSSHPVTSVQVSSSMKGQNQFLSVKPGQSGVLMYSNWTITMISSQESNYEIYLGGSLQKNGTIAGTDTVFLNITGSSASVTVQIGSNVYHFDNEIIARVPLQKYYGPKPPPLQYTLSEYEYGIARAFVASAFAIIIALLTARKYLLEKERREVVRI